MGRKNFKMNELKTMLDIIVGDEPKEYKVEQFNHVKSTLLRDDKMLPCRKKRMDFWGDVMEKVIE